MKGTHLVATLLALALALASCGGEDGQEEASAPEAGTSAAAQADSQSEPSTGSDRSESDDVAKGNGGSSVLDAERAPEQGNGKAGAPKDSPAGSGKKQESKGKPTTPAEGVASLSPSELRALHKDLYQQGCLAGFRKFARNPPKKP